MKPSRVFDVTSSFAAAVLAFGLAGCGGDDGSPAAVRPVDASRPDQQAQLRDAAPDLAVGRDAGADVSAGSDGGLRDAAGELDVVAAMDAPSPVADADLADAPLDDVATSSDANAPVESGEASADAGAAPTTVAILAAQGDNCLPCAQGAGCLDPALSGGSCEDTVGPAPPACQPLLGAAAVTEAQVCLATLNAMLTSSCAASAQGETPCLCGDADPSMCLAGGAPPTGAAKPYYDCDFHAAAMADLVTNFTNQAFGAGQANALVQCLNEFCGSGSCFP